MLISERQQKILSLLRDYPDYTVAQLASALFVSEPTIRRDFTELESKGFITKFYGGARVNHIAPDAEIPFIIRENEKSAAKTELIPDITIICISPLLRRKIFPTL